MKRSKKWRAAAALFDRNELYTPIAALRLVKESATTKFDPTVDVAIALGVDPRKADQMVRSTVNLPHGTGKTARVAAATLFRQVPCAPPTRQPACDPRRRSCEGRAGRAP